MPKKYKQRNDMKIKNFVAIVAYSHSPMGIYNYLAAYILTSIVLNIII